MYFIYVIKNKITGKMYVGLTCDPKERERRHLNGYETGCSALHSAVKKYGKEGFSFDIIESDLSLDDANKREQYWILKLDTMSPMGYNLRYGGDAGGFPSSETRLKMRKSQLGRKQSEEQKRKRADSHRGRKNSPKTIELMRQSAQKRTKFSMTGRSHSAETKRKMSMSHTKTHCKRGHPLSGKDSDVWISGNGNRNCKICRRFLRSGTVWNPSNL